MLLIPAPLQDLIKSLSHLPGLGRRSGKRAALALLAEPAKLRQLQEALETVAKDVKTCTICHTVDLQDPCHICASPVRDTHQLCVVEQVADLWAMEESGAYKGHYFVLGGVLNALHGVGVDDLRIPELLTRVQEGKVQEVILALSASMDGQSTAHLIAKKLKPLEVKVTSLAKGLPIGAGIDYMDSGTLHLALSGRQHIE